MILLGSMVSRPPPHPDLAIGGAVLLLALGGVGALLALERKEKAARTVGRILGVLAIAGFLLGLSWFIYHAWTRCFSGSSPGPPSFAGWMPRVDDSLHLLAASLGWFVLAGTLALVLFTVSHLRRWMPMVVVLLLGLITFLPSSGDHDRDGMGFRPGAADRLEWEAQEFLGDTSSTLWESHPEIFPAARWGGVAQGLFLGTLLVAGIGLTLTRRIRTLGKAPLAFPFLACASALLWGLCGILAVAQAAAWSSFRTPPADIEAAYTRAAVPPFLGLWLAAALLVIAFKTKPPPLQDPSP